MEFSVVIPAYNEQDRVGDSLGRIVAYMKEKGPCFEVIVVDDGSTDGTAEVVEAFSMEEKSVRLLRNESNRGKGYTVRRGVLDATGEIILMSDADLSTPIEEMEKLVRAIRVGGFDVAIGSRSLYHSDVRTRQPILRQSMGRLFNVFVRALAVRGIQDTQCGFKCFSAEAARAIFSRQRIDGFCFDVEVLLLARRLGYRVREVPVAWIDSARSSVHIVRAPLEMLVDLFRLCACDWRSRQGE